MQIDHVCIPFTISDDPSKPPYSAYSGDVLFSFLSRKRDENFYVGHSFNFNADFAPSEVREAVETLKNFFENYLKGN